MTTPKPIRLVVAGAGVMGQAHIQRILMEPEAQLAGIVDAAPVVADQAKLLGVAWTPDLETMLRQVNPDGVVIALPNQLHFEACRAAIRAGVATLLEKPVCDTVEEALQLAIEAENLDVPVLVGHHRRHSPILKTARQIVDSGRLGKITAVNGVCWFLKPADYYSGSGFWRRESGGGVVMINLVHAIDDLRSLCGEVESVQATSSNRARGFAVEDTAGIILKFRSGAVGTLTVSDASAAPWSWELTSGENKAFPRTDQFCYLIAGMEGSLSIPQLDVWSHGQGGHWQTPIHFERSQHLGGDPLVYQMRHFCEVVRRKSKPLLDLRGGAKTLETTLAVKQAAATGQSVFLMP